MAPRSQYRKIALGLWLLATTAAAQERAGEATVGFQHFYLANGSRSVANAFGLTLGFRQFLPDTGIVSLSLAPALSDGRFRTGDTFVELKRFPWLRQYWTFRAGDFRMPGELPKVLFNNLFYPEISGRGAWVEATHGGRTMGFLYGSATIQAGMRVPLRMETPQKMAGVYFRQSVGERLVLGARLLALTTDLEKLKTTPFLAAAENSFQSARTATIDALYTMSGPLKWYGELAMSQSSRPSGPLSFTGGPVYETPRFSLRANYVYQSESFLPLLGYNVGDRKGPYAEVKVRPLKWLDLNGGVSDYTNNVARDPRRPTFRSTMETAGGSLQLPSRVSLSGQWSSMKLAVRKSDDVPFENTANEQIQLTLAKPIGRHSLRLAAREFQQRSQIGTERQRTLEVADTFQYRVFSIGGEVRAQQMNAQQSKMSVFVRGNGQINLKRFSAFANIETGNDLANRTLFATSATNTTVLGGAVRLGQDSDFSVEAFRSNLVTALTPQNVFVLQGQGVYVPVVLSALNQWSLYFRMTKRLQWGKPLPPGAGFLGGAGSPSIQLKGSIEGFVSAGEGRWAEGIPVALEGGPTVLTGANGRFRFEGIGEGQRRVSIAMNELPADYDPGTKIESSVLVRPGKLSRVDLDVISVGYAVHGIVRGPPDTAMGTIVLKLMPSDRYTTPDNSGKFSFYNVREGSYEIVIAVETLPAYAVLKSPARTPIFVGPASGAPPVQFEFDVRPPAKPVRKVILLGN